MILVVLFNMLNVIESSISNSTLKTNRSIGWECLKIWQKKVVKKSCLENVKAQCTSRFIENRDLRPMTASNKTGKVRIRRLYFAVYSFLLAYCFEPVKISVYVSWTAKWVKSGVMGSWSNGWAGFVWFGKVVMALSSSYCVSEKSIPLSNSPLQRSSPNNSLFLLNHTTQTFTKAPYGCERYRECDTHHYLLLLEAEWREMLTRLVWNKI